MKRRQLLLTGSVGLSTALSGCGFLSSGGDGGSDGDADSGSSGGDGTTADTETPTGPPAFEEVSLSAPDSVTVGSEFSLTLSVTNTGGETGTFETTVQLASSGDEEEGPSFSESVAVESVAAGESGETTVTVPAFDVIDDYEFTVADADASVTVRPEPVTAAVGETLSIGGDLQVSVDGVTLRESVLYPTTRSSGLSTSEEIAAFGAPSEHVLAIVTVTAENTGTETTSAPQGTIGVGDAELYGGGEGSPGTLLGQSGERFYGGGLPEIDPSSTATGYYLAKVPRETARGTVEVTGQVDSSGTLPERVWRAEPEGEQRSLPQMTVQSVDAPETAPLGRDYEVTVTVANEGDAAGRLRGVVQWDSEGGWAQLLSGTSYAELDTERPTGGVVDRSLEAGATTELTFSSAAVLNQQYSYRFAPFGQEWQIDFEAATLSFGERLKSQDNANIVVQDLRLQDTVTAYDDFQDEEYEAEPEDGNQFVAVQFQFTKRDEDEDYARTPDTSDFSLLADGNSVSSGTYVDDDIREDWFTPIEGDLEEQPEVAGWEFYEVPSEYTAGDLAVHYELGAGFGSSVSTVATWE